MTRSFVVPIKDDWLARHVEEPIDPDVPIVDAHHHCLAGGKVSGHGAEWRGQVIEPCNTGHRQGQLARVSGPRNRLSQISRS